MRKAVHHHRNGSSHVKATGMARVVKISQARSQALIRTAQKDSPVVADGVIDPNTFFKKSWNAYLRILEEDHLEHSGAYATLQEVLKKGYMVR
jgi:hypothetical protein